jgi:tetratricopeptide (TPR) repeat protein
MKHVAQIRELIEVGKYAEASSFLEGLLDLGPKNTEALKLKAMLLRREGRYREEAEVWEKIAQVDREDQDAVEYYLERQTEDREYFYFTDDIMGVGRRFLAYPTHLIMRSAHGLVGCLVFLIFSKIGTQYPVLQQPTYLFLGFGLCVVWPWIRIISAYMRALKSITLTKRGIIVDARFRRVSRNWDEVSEIVMAYHEDEKNYSLSLVFIPKDHTSAWFEISLDDKQSSIRARRYFLRDVASVFKEPTYRSREELGLEKHHVVSY